MCTQRPAPLPECGQAEPAETQDLQAPANQAGIEDPTRRGQSDTVCVPGQPQDLFLAYRTPFIRRGLLEPGVAAQEDEV
jgi:hypothetical protein